ncbi:MAG: hypothetical protein ACRDMY_01185 [Gaiellaceae bacterium]
MTRLLPLVVLALVACGGDGDSAAPGEPSPPAPDVIDAADSGQTFELPLAAETSLRLSSEYSWEEPELSGDAVELTPVDYLQDPGFSEWLVRGARPGSVTISSVGTPACAGQHDCPDEPFRFQVTITVAE